MLVALNKNSERYYAWESEKTDAPFFCPECSGEVILKQGQIKEPHFAHKPPIMCQYGEGETQLHSTVKRSLYEALTKEPICSKVEIERRLNGVRPDVSLYVGKTPIAIEIQNSSLSIDNISERTVRLSKLGIYVVWIIPFPEPIEDEEFRSQIWESFLHAMYYGREYFWMDDDVYVNAVHHDPVYNYSGYRLKRTKIANTFPDALHLVKDFKKTVRPAFETDNYTIPGCKLWLDKQSAWWEQEEYEEEEEDN